MGKWVNVSEVNNIVGKALESCKGELSPSFYRGARLMLDKINEMAVEIADTPQTDTEITRNSLRTDCSGCGFVGTYDTEFPCANCVRKDNKDYYDSEYTQGSE